MLLEARLDPTTPRCLGWLERAVARDMSRFEILAMIRAGGVVLGVDPDPEAIGVPVGDADAKSAPRGVRRAVGPRPVSLARVVGRGLLVVVACPAVGWCG